MGKGADNLNCKASAGMGMAGLLDIPEENPKTTLQSMLISDPEVLQKAQEGTAKLSADKMRSREVEEFERKWAADTLDHAWKMREEGRDEKTVNAYFTRRARDLSRNRGDELMGQPDSSSSEGRQFDLNNNVEKVIAATAATEIFDSSGHPDLAFQEEFMNSPDFIENFRKVISHETADKGKTTSSKSMEDAYRDAALLTVGIYNSSETVGSWTSPNGTKYHIEVLREFIETALMDLIMMAKPVDGSEARVYAMQWKSYRTNGKIGLEPQPGAEPNVRSIKISKLTELGGKQKHSLAAIARETQLRFLATNTFADTTAHSQPDSNGESQLITHTTRLSMPEVHRAISRAKDLPSLFRPVEKGDGQYGFMEAALETKNRDGAPVKIRILSQMSVKLDKNGKPERKNGCYVVDTTDSAGVNKGKISIDIAHEGWHKLHKLSCFSKSYAQVIAQYPEKLKQLGISLND